MAVTRNQYTDIGFMAASNEPLLLIAQRRFWRWSESYASQVWRSRSVRLYTLTYDILRSPEIIGFQLDTRPEANFINIRLDPTEDCVWGPFIWKHDTNKAKSILLSSWVSVRLSSVQNIWTRQRTLGNSALS